MTEDLRYPIGEFHWAGPSTQEQRLVRINQIAQAPCQLRAAVEGLTDQQLDTPYRPDGWTVRQVAHHIPDSHMNAYTRFKLALTEDQPTIKPYDESAWAKLQDTASVPIAVSLQLTDALHERWVAILNAMRDADFTRAFFHPESGKLISLDWALGMYAWHGLHHIAHITRLRERMNW